MTNTSRLTLILVIEDNLNDIELFKRVINRFDDSITIVIHKTGEDALEYLISVLTTPDLILLDLALPGMDGIEFMKAMRDVNRLKDIPVIIVTGRPMDIARAHSENANDYIVKPLTLERFGGLLERLGYTN